MNRLLIGSLVLLLGLLIALVPQYIFPVCSGLIETATGRHIPMKCFWTARAELGIGFIIGFSGLFMLITHNHGVRLGLSISVMLTSIISIALPVCLIGVCPSPNMPCHAGTLPALIILGGLTLLIATLNIAYLYRLLGKNNV